MTVAAERFFVFGFFAIQLSTLEKHGSDAVHMRAVWVFGLFALGVVLAVNGSPLFGDLSCGHPKPKAEKVRCNGVQIQRPVCLVTVQENGHAGNGDVRQAQNDKQNLPAGKVQKAIGQPVNGCVKYSRVDEQHAVAF